MTFPILSFVDNDILAVIVKAIRQVFDETEMPIASIDSDETADADEQIVTSIGIIGEVKGIIMFQSDARSSSNIQRAMLGEVFLRVGAERLTEIQMASFGEFSNQIAGRAITLLSDAGMRCDITPPAIFTARDVRSLVPDLIESHRRVIRGSFGCLRVFFGIQSMEESR